MLKEPNAELDLAYAYIKVLEEKILILDRLLTLSTDEMKTFVRRVEEGSIQSVNTYTKMKNVLSTVENEVKRIVTEVEKI